MKQKAEIPGLTGMRGLAAMYVMLYHFTQSPTSIVPLWFSWFSGVGWSGVDFFFVLSGYLLATLYSKPTRQYLVRRVFRTFPLYYVSLPLYVIAGFIVFSPVFLVYAQDFFTQTFYNSALWTLTLEELFYFVVFPVILLSKLKPKYLVAIGLASAFLWALQPNTRMESEQMPAYFICYAVGILLAKHGTQITSRVKPTRSVLGSVVAFFVASDLLMTWLFGANEISPVAPVLYSAAYGLVIVFMQESPVFNNPLSHYLGKISYGIYILQMPFLWIIAHPSAVMYLGPAVESLHLSIFESVPLAGAVTLVVSAASYHWFESPLISLGRRITSTATRGS